MLIEIHKSSYLLSSVEITELLKKYINGDDKSTNIINKSNLMDLIQFINDYSEKHSILPRELTIDILLLHYKDSEVDSSKIIITYILLFLFNQSISVVLPFINTSLHTMKYPSKLVKDIQKYKYLMFFSTKYHYWNVILKETTEYTPLPLDVFDKPLSIPTLSVKRIKIDESDVNSTNSINTSLYGQYWDLLRQYTIILISLFLFIIIIY